MISRLQLTVGLTWLVFSLGCFFGAGSDPIPEPTTCVGPFDDATVSTLEIGRGEPFEPLQEGDATWASYGGQGLPMIFMYLRTDAGGPACMEQNTVILDGNGERLSSLSTALRTSARGGHRLTDEIPIIVRREPWNDELITIESTAGGQTARVQLLGVGPEPYSTSTTGTTGQTGDTGSTTY